MRNQPKAIYLIAIGLFILSLCFIVPAACNNLPKIMCFTIEEALSLFKTFLWVMLIVTTYEYKKAIYAMIDELSTVYKMWRWVFTWFLLPTIWAGCLCGTYAAISHTVRYISHYDIWTIKDLCINMRFHLGAISRASSFYMFLLWAILRAKCKLG